MHLATSYDVINTFTITTSLYNFELNLFNTNTASMDRDSSYYYTFPQASFLPV